MDDDLKLRADTLDLDSSIRHHIHHLHPPPSHQHPAPPAAVSDGEDDDHAADEDGCGVIGRSRRASTWQRMKWTDDVVRLLISLLALAGDEASADDAADRRRPSAAASASSASVVNRKGKWKVVSQMMMERGGFFVSPQQCEDKFNDLNKRYKRLNEILGQGSAARRVVENPSLLDSMCHISPKCRDDVRKILGSKHLFYPEMCAYHDGQRVPNSHDFNDEDEERSDDFAKGCEVFRVEINKVLSDKTKPLSERREWFKKRALELRVARLDIQEEAVEIEERRLKWRRFRNKKDKEMEGTRLDNERLRMESERMLLQVRQKELELDLRRAGEQREVDGGAEMRL